MKTIRADFNARTLSGYINLNTKESRQSIKESNGINVGEIIKLTNGKLQAVAKVIQFDKTFYFADPDWNTMKVIKE